MGHNKLINKRNYNWYTDFNDIFLRFSSQEYWADYPCNHFQSVIHIKALCDTEIKSLRKQNSHNHTWYDYGNDPVTFGIPADICHKDWRKRNYYPHQHISSRQETQNKIAIDVVSCQHTYEEKECVNSSSQRRFRIYRNYCSKQNPYCQSSKIVSNIQLL